MNIEKIRKSAIVLSALLIIANFVFTFYDPLSNDKTIESALGTYSYDSADFDNLTTKEIIFLLISIHALVSIIFFYVSAWNNSKIAQAAFFVMCAFEITSSLIGPYGGCSLYISDTLYNIAYAINGFVFACLIFHPSADEKISAIKT